MSGDCVMHMSVYPNLGVFLHLQPQLRPDLDVLERQLTSPIRVPDSLSYWTGLSRTRIGVPVGEGQASTPTSLSKLRMESAHTHRVQ